MEVSCAPMNVQNISERLLEVESRSNVMGGQLEDALRDQLVGTANVLDAVENSFSKKAVQANRIEKAFHELEDAVMQQGTIGTNETDIQYRIRLARHSKSLMCLLSNPLVTHKSFPQTISIAAW